MFEIRQTDHKIAIAWLNLTLKKKDIFSRKSTPVLNGFNGYAEFGTLIAIMGPSGSGLTSLIKCLNGLNNSNLSEETEILLSNSKKISTTFVGHNEKEFLISGLTAKQNMIYASKFKNSNCGQNINHEFNVCQIMADPILTLIMDTTVKNCSGGEQKRLAIALGLTDLNKPNIILIDEPTTGLDSNVAEVVINSFKELSINQNISIISTIHQPNSDVLQLFDNLYFLAKGGVCVFAGTSQMLGYYSKNTNGYPSIVSLSRLSTHFLKTTNHLY